ncbi:GntR family transcriptional regulator [Eremococcus coleocola]|uniref:UbiC transcription regulator-associated domain protein n=1 Tax=Eremococcus coleocola ACS-139-V-Col8 TaxID=908337 RepID=E4KQW7_9LACT|nr:GntR family transcriptional regulator [Eremococcus coleocola]EFR30618.1 UbiC transcription regulator-associated domain protein [Eremococcus coleocola ACS-139-V-Col8]
MQNKFDHIYKTLKSEIVAGRFRQTGFLPTEMELVERFSASRNTVRRAIQQLNSEGWSYSVKGRGVAVLENNNADFLFSRSGNFQGMIDLNSDKFNDKETIVTAFEEITVDKSIAKITSFNVGDIVYFVERLRKVNHQATMYDTSYFKKSILGTVTKEIFESSIYDYIDQELDFKIAASKSVMRVEGANAHDYDLITLNAYNCVGILENFVYTDFGQLFEHTTVRFAPDQYGIVSFNVRHKES